MLKVCRQIMSIKNLDVEFPENLSKDMSRKYQESQKIVEFIKSIGFKSDININNILFPSQRDMQRIFEFTLETITSSDATAEEYTQAVEKNFTKVKFGKQLSAWKEDKWVLPELNKKLYQKKKVPINEFILKFDNTLIKSLKKVASSNSAGISEIQKTIAQAKTEELSNVPYINFIQEEDNALLKYATGETNHNYFIYKLKNKNSIKPIEKSTTQGLIDTLDAREKSIDFLYHTYKENNFCNNVNIIKRKNQRLYGTISSLEISSLMGAKKKNVNQITGGNKQQGIEGNDSQTKKFKSKLDIIIENFEREKQQKNEEITELNNKLLSLVNKIENSKQEKEENKDSKTALIKELDELSIQNQVLLKEIEDQMNAFEQMKKLQKNQVDENEIIDEVRKLQQKYQELVNSWDEYSQEAKTQIDDLKTQIDTKKKEYKYKFEQISSLKKEIEEIASKISLKQELAQFLEEEYNKIPKIFNRNIYMNKIDELTKHIQNEKIQISGYLKEIKVTEGKIKNLNESIKQVDNEIEDRIFQDAKGHAKLKDVYQAFIKLRDGYNTIQKSILDTNMSKNKMKSIEYKVSDYKLKLENYDFKQLQDQVDNLKKLNGQQ